MRLVEEKERSFGVEGPEESQPQLPLALCEFWLISQDPSPRLKEIVHPGINFRGGCIASTPESRFLLLLLLFLFLSVSVPSLDCLSANVSRNPFANSPGFSHELQCLMNILSWKIPLLPVQRIWIQFIWFALKPTCIWHFFSFKWEIMLSRCWRSK